MDEQSQLELLAANGMLVKRPLVIGEDFGGQTMKRPVESGHHPHFSGLWVQDTATAPASRNWANGGKKAGCR